jgi:hypothetical protein
VSNIADSGCYAEVGKFASAKGARASHCARPSPQGRLCPFRSVGGSTKLLVSPFARRVPHCAGLFSYARRLSSGFMVKSQISAAKNDRAKTSIVVIAASSYYSGFIRAGASAEPDPISKSISDLLAKYLLRCVEVGASAVFSSVGLWKPIAGFSVIRTRGPRTVETGRSEGAKAERANAVPPPLCQGPRCACPQRENDI